MITQPAVPDHIEYLTMREAADRYHVSVMTLRRRIRTGGFTRHRQHPPRRHLPYHSEIRCSRGVRSWSIPRGGAGGSDRPLCSGRTFSASLEREEERRTALAR